MFRNQPKIRMALYAATLVVLGIVSTLNVLHIIDPSTAGQISGVVNTLATLLGVGTAGIAATNLGRQQIDGTFSVSGTAAEQLAQAAKNYATQRAADDATLSTVLRDIPAGHVATNVVATATAGPVVTACGDGLR